MRRSAVLHWFYLRWQLEGLPACVLHRAKPVKCTRRATLRECSHFRPVVPSARSPTLYKEIFCSNPIRGPSMQLLPQASLSSLRPSVSRISLRPGLALLALVIIGALTAPDGAFAKSRKDHLPNTGQNVQKKGVAKTTYRASSSEETRAERDRRLFRECKGMHNAGACKGYTRR